MPKPNRKSKTTFRISPEVLTKFQSCIEALGLRRDRYVNMVLPDAISWLLQAKTNSSTAERFWKAIHEVKRNSLQKVAVLLDADVLAKMNVACAKKHVPRDQFFQAFLESLIRTPANGNGPAPLPRAVDLIQDPFEVWRDGSGATPFDEIILPDFSEDDLREVLDNAEWPKA